MPVDLDQLAEFIALAPDAMLVAGPDGSIVLANGQAHRLFRAQPGELVGLCIDELVPATLRGRHAEHRAAYAATPSIRPMGAGSELAARRRDDTVFPTEISLSPLPGSGGLVLAAVRDLTDRKAAEQKLLDARLELERREARERQALEINDGIVQSLALAQYQLSLGELTDARESVKASLAAAKEIITDLLGTNGDATEIEPGDLRRNRSADVRRRH